MPDPDQALEQVRGSRSLGPVATVLLGIYLIALGPVMVYVLIAFWPSPEVVGVSPPPPRYTPAPTETYTPTPTETYTPAERKSFYVGPEPRTVSLFGRVFMVFGETRLLILVALGGAIGSYLRSVISFATYAETGHMPRPTWMWWCILQTYIGMLLATLFYMIMRGTTMPITTAAEQVNPFTTTGIAGLVGLFTQQATDKLAAFFAALAVDSSQKRSTKKISK